ncbi:DedA family inner membrane protein YdjX [Klebsiella pneumoniae IS43]|uniref:TVP38/TMEM64 family membrane protein n=1 Tax=Klebsiella pneumoniae IS43 TaxID=1432552 RepID=W1DG43_KLEPN|nr:DedA family inner membrane protein YdjX [Klebsiella pneumoniae IS43]
MATLAVISHRVGLHDLLTHLHLLQDTLRHQGAWGYLVYAALFIIATLCLIPGSLLVIAGGMLFGPLTGSLLSFAAATLASSLSFFNRPLAWARSAAALCGPYHRLSGD